MKMTSMGMKWALAVAAMGLVFSSASWAQQDSETDSGWSSTGIIYLLAPSLAGTVGIGPVEGDIDMNAGDVFSALDMAFLGIYVGEGDRWGVVVDVVYMDLSEDDISGPAGLVTGEVGNKQFSGLVSASYRMTDHTRLLAGFMYTDITADIRITSPLNSRYAKTSESWADPVVGVLFNAPISENWDFTGLAQIGGGMGADLAYVLTASVGWQFGEKTSLTLGYRYLDFDYEDGQGANRFKFDMKEYGPAVGFRFKW